MCRRAVTYSSHELPPATLQITTFQAFVLIDLFRGFRLYDQVTSYALRPPELLPLTLVQWARFIYTTPTTYNSHLARDNLVSKVGLIDALRRPVVVCAAFFRYKDLTELADIVMERMLLPAQVRVALRNCAWLSPQLWRQECKTLGVPVAVVRKLMVQSPEKMVVSPTINALRDPLSFCYSLVLERARPFVD